MGRTVGSRNRDYVATRHAMAVRMGPHLLRDDGEPATLTDLAAVAGVSATTLKHYFADRDGVFEAVLLASLADGRHFLEASADPGARPPEQSLSDWLTGAVEAWRRHGVGRLFAGSMALALESGRRGPAFLDTLLEPFLQSAEGLIGTHVERGELPALDVRAAALSLVTPVVLALLHQDNLGGGATRPLDVEEFARQHAQTVLHGLVRTSRQ